MLFSIVTVVFNGAATLQSAINSVAQQNCRDFEYIVLDGASTDGTVSILERNADRINHWASEPDAGIYDAWNKALRIARGEWIAFLGADDTYHPDALERYARAIERSPSANLQYLSSRVELIKHGKRVRTIGSAWSWPAFFPPDDGGPCRLDAPSLVVRRIRQLRCELCLVRRLRDVAAPQRPAAGRIYQSGHCPNGPGRSQ
jgi:glycosyltransferase involved in cell wall biosynthesis